MPPDTDAPGRTGRAERVRDALDRLTLAHAARTDAEAAARQATDAENLAARAALQAGATYAAIGERLGVSDTQARRKIEATGRPHR